MKNAPLSQEVINRIMHGHNIWHGSNACRLQNGEERVAQMRIDCKTFLIIRRNDYSLLQHTKTTTAHAIFICDNYYYGPDNDDCLS